MEIPGTRPFRLIPDAGATRGALAIAVVVQERSCDLVRAFAPGHKTCEWVNLNEYAGKAKHEGPQSDRLVVHISLKKSIAKHDAK